MRTHKNLLRHVIHLILVIICIDLRNSRMTQDDRMAHQQYTCADTKQWRDMSVNWLDNYICRGQQWDEEDSEEDTKRVRVSKRHKDTDWVTQMGRETGAQRVRERYKRRHRTVVARRVGQLTRQRQVKFLKLFLLTNIQWHFIPQQIFSFGNILHSLSNILSNTHNTMVRISDGNA